MRKVEDRDRRKFQSRDCRLQDARLWPRGRYWILGWCLGNPGVNVATIVAWAGVGKSTLVNHWLRERLLTIVVLRSSFLAGPFTGKAQAGNLCRRMNFLTPRSIGLEIQNHGSERHGRKAKDWPTFVAHRRTPPYLKLQ